VNYVNWTQKYLQNQLLSDSNKNSLRDSLIASNRPLIIKSPINSSLSRLLFKKFRNFLKMKYSLCITIASDKKDKSILSNFCYYFFFATSFYSVIYFIFLALKEISSNRIKTKRLKPFKKERRNKTTQGHLLQTLCQLDNLQIIFRLQ
jgi:hypothetical protein